MNIKEFYKTIGGNYDAAKSRMLNDERIEKYLKKFSSYLNLEALENAMDEKDYSKIFAITHDTKGMCLNLELTPLAKSASELCEAVRHGAPTVDIVPLFETVRSDYDSIITAICDATK